MPELDQRPAVIDHRGLSYKLIKSRFWGTYYVPENDERPLPDISFQLKDDFKRIPAEVWTPIVKLFQAFSTQCASNLEVGVYLLAKPDGSEWAVALPRQTVSGASVDVRGFDDCIDLITGEQLESFPPDGWVHAGDVH